MGGNESKGGGGVMREPWSIDITDPFHRFLAKLLTFLPNLLVMIIILIIGFLIAWIIKKLVFHFLKISHFDKLSERWGLTHVLSKGDISYSPSHVLIHVLYWLIIFITLILGVNALQVPATEALITRFFNYLPKLLSAILVLVVGYPSQASWGRLHSSPQSIYNWLLPDFSAEWSVGSSSFSS